MFDDIATLFEIGAVIALTVSGWIITLRVRRRMQKFPGTQGHRSGIGVAQDVDASGGNGTAGKREQSDPSALSTELVLCIQRLR